MAILHGEEDALINREYLEGLVAPTLWSGSLRTIPKAGHLIHWEEPEAVSRELCALLDESAR